MMAYPVRDSYSGYAQQYSTYQPRAHHTQPAAASSLNINPYAGFAPAPQQQPYQQPPSRSPQSSDSPVTEDGSRPSLPSISNLLGIADGDRTSHDGGTSDCIGETSVNLADPYSASQQAQQQTQQAQQQAQQQQQQQAISAEQRQRASYPSHDLSSSQRNAIPPTPPLRNDSVIESSYSSSNIPTGSSLSAQPYFMGSGLNNLDADHQRVVQANFMKRHSIPSQPNTSPYGTSPYTTSPYHSSPGAMSNGSYYSPTDPAYPSSSIYQQQQRPLPSNFPPPAPAVQSMQSTPSLPTTNPWEHHHYISASSQATFPQSQDRYICQTCNKAFSRPSSLKIHSHSHTGEKPFKCPHAGCGKAFSVRSNMKRHERGCHTGMGGMGGSSHLG